MTGRFITLEGGEGAGKSTQLVRLAAALRGRGVEVVETREPGGSPGAEAIRALLLEGEAERWTAEAEALLFAAARADHVARTIKPALARGAWVLCDRFVDSSVAYQGYGGRLGAEAVWALHRIGSGGFLPDRTLLLTLGAGAASERARLRDGGAGDRIGGREGAFHRAVSDGFTAIAAADPGRFRLVDAEGAPEQVTSRLVAALDDLL